MEYAHSLRAFVLGASGSVGRELVLDLLKSPKWSQVTVLVRKQLEEWDTLSADEKRKLQILQQDNLDSLSDPSKWDLNGYSTVFCCLGAGAGEVSSEVYTKVNCTYPYNGAKLALHFNVPHYSLVSSTSANSKSWLPKPKERGVMEDNLQELKFPHLSILKPGLITHRRPKERFMERLCKYVPFMINIKASEVATGLRLDAELQHSTPHKKSIVIYRNADIHKLVKTGAYPETL